MRHFETLCNIFNLFNMGAHKGFHKNNLPKCPKINFPASATNYQLSLLLNHRHSA